MNDQEKFLSLVREFPQVWNRSHPDFREKNMKERCWAEISKICRSPANTCKDLFKALREKYLREREKTKNVDGMSVHWPLLKSMDFLEPHIVLRKQSTNEEAVQKAEAFSQSFCADQDADFNYKGFDVQLVALVRKATPIWDRSAKTFSSKPLKQEIWRNLAIKLGKPPHQCALRWKALREKYIRQKCKFQDGETKWYLLDQMSFLDEVILYRRKHSYRSFNPDNSHLNLYETFSSDEFNSTNSTNSNVNNDNFDSLTFDSENSMNESSNDFPVTIKQEEDPDVPDSSNGHLVHVDRKRPSQDIEESQIPQKREKIEENTQNHQLPEQVFGNLVAVMLSKKSEGDKNHAMVEIMKILTK